MSIDGIPQNNNLVPKMSKVDTPAKTTPAKAPSPAPAPKNIAKPESTATPENPAVTSETGNAQTTEQSVLNLQSVSEKLRQSHVAFQTRNQITDLGRSIIETKDDLSEVSQERMEAIVESGEQSSFFSNMGIMEKAQHINRLKDQIQDMEIARGALVKDLREQVMANTYDPSGEDILQGMLDEYF